MDTPKWKTLTTRCKFGFSWWIVATDGRSERGDSELSCFRRGLRRDVSPRRVTRMRQDWSSSTASPTRSQTQVLPPAQSPAARAHTHQSPPTPPGLPRESDENSEKQPGPQHDDRNESHHPTASQLIAVQRRVRSSSASLQEAVIGGRRSASDGEGASKPGHASGTRRHLMGRTNMFVELISKSARFRMTPRSRGTHASLYWNILSTFAINSYFWKIWLAATTELTV